MLGNDDAESDERKAKRSSDDDVSYLTEVTKMNRKKYYYRVNF
jgi:hypothetical protein